MKTSPGLGVAVIGVLVAAVGGYLLYRAAKRPSVVRASAARRSVVNDPCRLPPARPEPSPAT
jgi:hypothetical protein